jgi:nucleotide-binding universal stress UspA family protein
VREIRILVCTDGSKQSLKAIEAAAKVADGCRADEVAVIHVYEVSASLYFGSMEGYVPTGEAFKRFKESEEHLKEERKKHLSQAKDYFESKNINVRTIFLEGHPAETIASVVADEGFDMVVIGSRGLGGLKKMLLGSVSNAVAQQVAANVLLVK